MPTKLRFANEIYMDFVFLYLFYMFIYCIIYFNCNIAFLLINCLFIFIILCIIHTTFRGERYFKIVNFAFQIMVFYNIITSVLYFGWGYGFEFYILCLITINYFYGDTDIKKRLFLVILQSAIYIFLYFYTIEMPLIYGDENFKKLLYLLNLTFIFIGFIYLQLNTNSVGIVSFVESEKSTLFYDNLSSQDSLTKIHNRKKILKLIDRDIGNFKKGKVRTICIILCDIDDFKRINDTFGHIFGDKVLQSVATSLQNNFEKYGNVGRYGGEEFLICLTKLDEPEAKRTIDNIRVQIENLKPDGVAISATFGAVFTDNTQDSINTNSLIYQADMAMYQGKKSGKNKLVFKRYED